MPETCAAMTTPLNGDGEHNRIGLYSKELNTPLPPAPPQTVFEGAAGPDPVAWRLQRLEGVLRDLRPPDLRMAHDDVALHRKWSAVLGYTREQVLSS